MAPAAQLPPPSVVVMQYWYFCRPEATPTPGGGSTTPVQFASMVFGELVSVMSAPVPSLTVPGIGGATESTRWPLEHALPTAMLPATSNVRTQTKYCWPSVRAMARDMLVAVSGAL